MSEVSWTSQFFEYLQTQVIDRIDSISKPSHQEVYVILSEASITTT